MVYNFSRLLIIILNIFILLLILIKSKIILVVEKKINNKRKIIIKNKIISIILSIITISLCFVSLYPFEGYFLTFETIEKSFSYKIFDSHHWDNYIINSDNCYFIFSRNPTSSNIGYHSVYINDDNSINLIDFKNIEHKYTQAVFTDEVNTPHLITCTAIYDKYANKTCYFIKYALPTGNTDNCSISFESKDLSCIYYKRGVYGIFQFVDEGYFNEFIDLTINNVSIKLNY